MNKQLRGNILLFITALIWGSTFVAQSVAMDSIGPFTFTAVRMMIGGLSLLPVIMILRKTQPAPVIPDGIDKEAYKKKANKMLLISGLCCGAVLFTACALQQVGIVYTTAGKAGFITALYIVLVPILGLFLGKKVRVIVWLCVAVAAVGLYLLCITEDLSIGKGDFFVLICALFYAIHILVVDYFSPKTDPIKLSCLQFFVCAAISFFPTFIFENPQFASIVQAWTPIFYSGVLSCGIGFTFQVIAQRDTSPTITSLILSLEAVFAVLAGFIILHEILSPRELVGCLLMFAAIIVAQVPSRADRITEKQEDLK